VSGLGNDLGSGLGNTTQSLGNVLGDNPLGNTVSQTGQELGNTVSDTGEALGNTVNGLTGVLGGH
jgi:hypothetical protein